MAQVAKGIEIWQEQFSRDLQAMQAGGLVYHHEKILLVAFLDALAKTVNPDSNMLPWQRFVRFLEAFTPWKEGDRISVPHLVRLLERLPDSRFDKV